MSEFSVSLFGVTRQCARDADFYTNNNSSAFKYEHQEGRTSQGLTLLVQMPGNRLSEGSMNMAKQRSSKSSPTSARSSEICKVLSFRGKEK